MSGRRLAIRFGRSSSQKNSFRVVHVKRILNTYEKRPTRDSNERVGDGVCSKIYIGLRVFVIELRVRRPVAC